MVCLKLWFLLFPDIVPPRLLHFHPPHLLLPFVFLLQTPDQIWCRRGLQNKGGSIPYTNKVCLVPWCPKKKCLYVRLRKPKWWVKCKRGRTIPYIIDSITPINPKSYGTSSFVRVSDSEASWSEQTGLPPFWSLGVDPHIFLGRCNASFQGRVIQWICRYWFGPLKET